MEGNFTDIQKQYIPPIVYYGGRKLRMIKNIYGLMKQYAIPEEDLQFIDVFGGSGIVGLQIKHNCSFKSVVINDFDFRIFAVHKCGELQKFKIEVYEQFHNRIVKYFYGAVGIDYHQKIIQMLKYPKKLNLPEIATVSILRSIFNFRGKWKTDDNPIKGCYGQRPPITSQIWVIPELEKQMKNGITDKLYNGIKATCYDYRLLFEKYKSDNCLLYLDPPYADNTTVYRKGEGNVIAFDCLERLAELDIPFIYSHDEHRYIIRLAEELGFQINRYENRSRSNVVKIELLIHNLDRFYDKREPNLFEAMQKYIDRMIK